MARRTRMTKEMKKKLEFLTKDDTYSMALALLYAVSEDPEYSTINELAYILDHDSFTKFIRYYGGQTIKIPTQKELEDSLKLLLLFKYCKMDDITWRDAVVAAGFSKEESMSIRHRMTRFMDHLDEYNYRIGGLLGSDKKEESSNWRIRRYTYIQYF